MDDLLLSTRELPAIDQRTIECDITHFTRWLNRLADQVNFLTKGYYEMKDTIDDHEQRISCLEEKVAAIEVRLKALEDCCEEVQRILQDIQNQIDTLNQAINMLNQRLDQIYNWLPIPYGMIDPMGWKFAMGNINVMSDNNTTPAIDGAGIYTSGQIEDNDLYFN